MTPEQLKKQHDAAILTSYQLVQKNAKYVWDQLEEDIEPPSALLKFNGHDLIYGGSIIMIQGKQGAHKSRLAGAIATLLLSNNNGQNLMGFCKATDAHYPTIYLDTERNKTQQLPLMLKQVHKETNLEKDELMKRLTLAPLSEISRMSRIEVMGKVFQDIPKGQMNTVVIIIDIVSDFIQDFNNVVGTNQIIDIITSASSKRDITFIVVLHENPGNADKARGHLGTELANKASTVLQIGQTDVADVFKIHVKKSRTTAPPPSLLLKFDPDVNTLVPMTDDMLATKVHDPEGFRLKQILAENTFVTMERKQLLAILEKALNWSERKIEDKLKEFISKKTEFVTFYGMTYLEKSRGKTTEYKMVSIDSPKSQSTSLEAETESITNDAIDSTSIVQESSKPEETNT